MRTSSIILAVVILFTFPIWIGIAGGLFGMFFGLIGGFFGLIAGLFGAIIGAIAAMFGVIFHLFFGWSNDWNGFHFPGNGLGFFIFIIIVAFLIQSKQRKQDR